MNNNHLTRRHGGYIMAKLVLLLGSLLGIMVLAVINGSLGFISAMGVTVMGAVGVAKALGENIALSYGVIMFMAISFGLVRGLLRYFEQYSNHYIAFRLLAVLRHKIFGVLRILCPAKLESKQKGAIIAMITGDIETLEVFYAHTISPICIATIVSSVVLVFVRKVSSVYIALVALAGYIFIGVAMPMITSGKLKTSGVKYRAELSAFNGYFLDSIKGIKDIVLNNAGDMREKEVNRRSDLLLEETKKMKNETAKATALTEAAVSFFIFASLVVGMVLVAKGTVTIGRMIIGVVTVFSSFGPVIAVSALPSNLTQTFASGDRVLNLFDEKPEVVSVTEGKDIEYENLNVENLSFAYDENTKVLENICINAAKGEIIGIVGRSGCGKSTLLKLLLRFWQKTEGGIKYNGVDIDNINTDSLLENVTMVSQTTYLFDDTIEENLRIAKQDATHEEIVQACKLASVHDFIMSLPQGYSSMAGALGDNLSAGEKQRIGLARAFLRGSRLILLDEPTSNVDSINEGVILKALKQQKHKKGIILVSHRESTMAIAERVYHIKDGKITA